MQPVPRIFVSATSRDLRTARTLVSEGLRRMECLPIVQDDFPPDYKSVREMLVTKIKTCNAVVHLAGFYYGAEPQPTPPDPERRSFTQMEYEIAMELGLPCYVFLCGEKFPFDEHDPEPEEKRALQMAHRNRLLSRDELFYEFETREDLNSRTRELQLSVEGLRDELAKERKRRRMTMVISAAALLVALVGGIYLLSKTQSQEAVIAETTGKLNKQGELIEMLLVEQERLRSSSGRSELAALAEENVAKKLNLAPEEIRRSVASAVESAEESLAKAVGTEAEADALKKLADARMAAGFETEAIATYGKRYELIDRETDPLGWLEAAEDYLSPAYHRDSLAKDIQDQVAAAVEFALNNPAIGSEHPVALDLMELQGRIFGISREDEKAIAMTKRVLETRERVLGADAPDTLESLFLLAAQYKIQEDYTSSDPLFEKLVAANVRLHGEEDVRTINAKYHLAASYMKQKRYPEASELLQKLAEVSERILGKADALTLVHRSGLGKILEGQGRPEEALEVFRGIQKDAEELRGPDDEVTLTYSGILANKLLKLGEYEEAEQLYRKELEARIRTVGVNQPMTIDAMKGLSLVLDSKGDTDGYLEIMRRMLAAEIQVLGSDSIKVSVTQERLALALMGDGQNEAALSCWEECFLLRKRVQGINHYSTLMALRLAQLAALRTNDLALAEKWGTEALDTFEKLKNPPADLYAYSLYWFAICKENQGDKTAALGYVRKAARVAAEGVEKENEIHGRTAEMIEDLTKDQP